MRGDGEGGGRGQRSQGALRLRGAPASIARDLAPGLVLFVGLCVALWLAYGSLASLTHFGWDTYPMIASSRVEGLGDAVTLLGQELMDGRYPGGHFYRPLTTLSFALDGVLFDETPRGYHLTDLAILAATVLCVFALAARLFGTGAAAVAAAAIVALHPLQIEVVPVSARRADTFCTLFAVLAVLASVRPGRSASWAAVASVLALASKETGAVALPAALAARALLTEVGSPRERVVAAARWAALPCTAVAVFVAARSIVLGGLGGHADSSLLLAPIRAAAAGASAVATLVHPQPFFADPRLDVAWQAAALAGLAGMAALVASAPSDAHTAGAPAGRPRWRTGVLGLAVVWGIGLALLTGVSGRFEPWYGGPFVAPFGLAVAAGVDGFAASVRRRDLPRIAWGVVALALCLAGCLRFTPVVHRYGEWERLDARQTRFLADFRSQLEGLEPGVGAVVRGLPLWEEPDSRVGVRGAAGLAQYSVQAFADLQPSTHPIRVLRTAGTRVPISPPGMLQIDIVADEEGASPRDPFATIPATTR